MILLLGLDNDLHLDKAVLELQSRFISFIRIDPTKINGKNTTIDTRISSQGTTATIRTYSGTFNSHEISGVWCRYALETLTSTRKNSLSRFIEEEFFTAIKGALLCIPSKRWINDPYLDARADNKPYQLHIATKNGLCVPETIISHNKQDLGNFARIYGSCIIKALGDAPLMEARADGIYGNYTALLNEETLLHGKWNKDCPVFLQCFIPKEADVRATVIDGNVFAAKLTADAHSSLQFVDFRNRQDIQTTAFELSAETQAGMRGMLSHLGLRYAAFDFSLHEDTLYFLEANVAGNYLWTEIEANLPITKAIVDALTSTN